MPKYQEIRATDLPLDKDGNLRIDVYVFMPHSDKYLRLALRSEKLTSKKLAKLEKHPDPKLYVEDDEIRSLRPSAKAPKEELQKIQAPDAFRGDLLGVEVQAKLSDIFKNLESRTSPEKAEQELQLMSDEAIGILAPETEDFKQQLMANVKNVNFMHDAAAITSLAVLFSLANGFTSRKTYRELSYACMIMDMGLAGVPEETMQMYYKERDKLPPEVLTNIKHHPARSHSFAQQNLNSATDGILGLVLSHHELYNGKGYPRAIRNESLFPVGRILSIAVDVYEHMKGSKLNGRALSMSEALLILVEENIEGHLRRHNRQSVHKIFDFVSGEAGGETTSATGEGAPPTP